MRTYGLSLRTVRNKVLKRADKFERRELPAAKSEKKKARRERAKAIRESALDK